MNAANLTNEGQPHNQYISIVTLRIQVQMVRYSRLCITLNSSLLSSPDHCSLYRSKIIWNAEICTDSRVSMRMDLFWSPDWPSSIQLLIFMTSAVLIRQELSILSMICIHQVKGAFVSLLKFVCLLIEEDALYVCWILCKTKDVVRISSYDSPDAGWNLWKDPSHMARRMQT